MIRKFLASLLMVLSLSGASATDRIPLDEGWKFSLGHAQNAHKDFGYGFARLYAKTAENYGTPIRPEYDDSAWMDISLPHDWAVTLPFEPSGRGGLKDHGHKPIGFDYPENSVGWYRKTFETPKGDRVRMVFDGISRNSEIWINSFYLGRHLSGYIGVSYDITDYLNEDAPNVVTVRVDATREEGWWYEGAGIYRHVWLEPYPDVAFTEHGIFVSAIPSDDFSSASVHISAEIESWKNEDTDAKMEVTIFDHEGVEVGSRSTGITVPHQGACTSELDFSLNAPELWDIDSPHRYTARCILMTPDGREIHSRDVRFGVRRFDFSADKGLFLNGRSIKIQGVACHQDHAGTGVAVPDFLQYYRIGLLKEMGANAYRCSHNPPSPVILDACDSLGIIVLDETRLTNSCPEYIGQFESMVLRDRNHPCIFMWSIGNEEERLQSTVQGEKIARSFKRALGRLDPTRPITIGANNGAIHKGVNSVVDIRGFNYGHKSISSYHDTFPEQPVMGSEMASTVTTRGVVQTDSVKCYLSDRDVNYPSWGSSAEDWWTIAYENEWFLGGFVWTGFDYRGEPTPFHWPNVNSHFGIMDMCGFPKNIYYYYQSWWTDKDFIHISPHWNSPVAEGESVAVWVNTNADKVELFLNGKSLGQKVMPRAGHLEWELTYHPGTLKAVAWKNGRKLSESLSTTGEPYAIVLGQSAHTIRADGSDGLVVNACVVDKKGRIVPDASDYIRFTPSAGIRIIGLGNGDPNCHEAEQGDGDEFGRSLFNGYCQVILQSDGTASPEAILSANAPGLKGASIRVACN